MPPGIGLLHCTDTPPPYVAAACHQVLGCCTALTPPLPMLPLHATRYWAAAETRGGLSDPSRINSSSPAKAERGSGLVALTPTEASMRNTKHKQEYYSPVWFVVCGARILTEFALKSRFTFISSYCSRASSGVCSLSRASLLSPPDRYYTTVHRSIVPSLTPWPVLHCRASLDCPFSHPLAGTTLPCIIPQH
jgi:hypothetical protein